MERISLPGRTVATRLPIIASVAGALILAMLLWMADVVYLFVAHRYVKRDFREVTLTRAPIRVFNKDGDLSAEYTLFQEGGRTHALRGEAEACERMDSWDGEIRYLYARGLYREYRNPGGPATGLVKEAIPGEVDVYLRAAIRIDPMNRFYRQTRAQFLASLKDASRQVEVDRLVDLYPPQDTYGQIRTAEMVAARPDRAANASRIVAHYRRALELVSTEISSGLVDMDKVDPTGVNPAPALGPTYVARTVDGLLKNIGRYDLWSRALPDFPEAHWLVAGVLADGAHRLSAEADKEYLAVVDSVNRRLDVEKGFSTFTSLLQILLPLPRPGYLDRFLMNREIGEAATVLKNRTRSDDAIRMYRLQVERTPGNAAARLALGRALVEEAQALSRTAGDYRGQKASAEATARALSARDPAGAARATAEAEAARTKAEALDARMKAMYDEADAQASAILREDPRSAEALNLRRILPGQGGEIPSP